MNIANETLIMNPEFPSNLAAQIKANPSLFEDMDDALLGDLIFHYVEGDMPAEDAAEVEAMIRTNAKAKAIHQRVLEANRFSASEEGAAWLESLPDRLLPPRVAPQELISHQSFFDRLSEWMVELFPSLTLQAAHADGKGDDVVKSFQSAADDPYKAQLVHDRVGRWFLRVSTADAVAARVKLRVELEQEAPVLEFLPEDAESFFAQVRLSESMAEALKAGHRPVFRPAD